MLNIARSRFRPAKLLCALMSWKAFSREDLDVSVGKASRTALGLLVRMVEMEEAMESGRRARRATARLPWEGEERMRAMPVPWGRDVSMGFDSVRVEVQLTVFGPAPINIASPEGGIVLLSIMG